MQAVANIGRRLEYSSLKIFSMRILRYIQCGYLLHLVTVFSILMVFLLSNVMISEYVLKTDALKLAVLGYGSGYFFTLIFFSQLDARSRFRNYMMIKDKLFEYGFDARLLRPFVYSRCQRDAIVVAARDMNYTDEWEKLNYQLGFRWYHVLPHLVVRKPGILLTREYWNKTLFVKPYQSKYFLW